MLKNAQLFHFITLGKIKMFQDFVYNIYIYIETRTIQMSDIYLHFVTLSENQTEKK